MKICPLCGEAISNWADATGKTVRLDSGVLVHKKCKEEKDAQVSSNH